jgi:hypothetical protein
MSFITNKFFKFFLIFYRKHFVKTEFDLSLHPRFKSDVTNALLN